MRDFPSDGRCPRRAPCAAERGEVARFDSAVAVQVRYARRQPSGARRPVCRQRRKIRAVHHAVTRDISLPIRWNLQARRQAQALCACTRTALQRPDGARRRAHAASGHVSRIFRLVPRGGQLCGCAQRQRRIHFTFLVTDNFQIDARVGVGLNAEADDVFTGVGFAWRYGPPVRRRHPPSS